MALAFRRARPRLRRLITGLLVTLALSVAAAAVQPLYRVSDNIIYLPLNGVALNSRSGRLAWRFPRLAGQTATNGHGLLIVSWVAGIQPMLARRVTRFCRLRTADGKRLWCRDWPDVLQWKLDGSGKHFYVHTRGRLEVLSTSDGEPDRGFDVNGDASANLLSLPGRGVMLLERHRDWSEGLEYRPGAAGLEAERLPADVYAFNRDGGLLLYARQQDAFFLATPLRLLAAPVRALVSDRVRLPAGALDWAGPRSDQPAPFPHASLNQHGYVVTDQAGSAPVVRGGTYGGRSWQAPRNAAEPKLAISADTAVVLEPAPGGKASQVTGWALGNGSAAYRRSVPGTYAIVRGGNGVVVLQSDQQIRVLDARTGRELWRQPQHEGALAALAPTALVFWEDGGKLVALARSNGALLWRVKFQTVGFPKPF